MSKFVLRAFLKGTALLLSLAILYHVVRGPITPLVKTKLNIENPPNAPNAPVLEQLVEEEPKDSKESSSVDDSWNEAKFEELAHLYHLKDIDCKGVLDNDTAALQHAVNTSAKPEYQGFFITDEDYIERAKNCDKFVKDRGYITSTLSKEEEDFPLAYSIIAHKGSEPLERLLRAIYRPQNIYCIHIDAKSKPIFFEAISAIAGCFPNVLMAPRRIDVRWGEFTVLEPELVCMEELFRRKATWRYFINLTGQEFPLKSNRELVEILTAYKGANDVEGVRRSANKKRWTDSGPVPEGLTPVKGSVHIVVNRDFVKFIVEDPRAKKLLEWVKPQQVADETFFATIGHNPKLGLRGTFIGLEDVEQMMDRKPWFNRYKSWLDWPCAATRVHDVCILSVGDLPLMNNTPFLIANKFYLEKSQVAYTCIEQKLFNSTRDLHLGRATVNTTVYENSIIVNNRLRPEYIKLKFHAEGDGGKIERKKNYW